MDMPTDPTLVQYPQTGQRNDPRPTGSPRSLVDVGMPKRLCGSALEHMIRGYRLEKILRAGKLTTVYHARTEELWLPPELTIMLLHIPKTLSTYARKQFTERFLRETRGLSKLRHPSLHPLFGYGEDGEQLYWLFPAPTPTTTLAGYLHGHIQWSPSEIFSLLAPISSAFDYLHHQGVVYQFLTPDNILLQEHAPPLLTGTGLLQMLLMQGLDEELYNHEDGAHLKNVAGDYVGMSTYLAPEVVRGEPMNTRSDIYALGILLFELLSGEPPFTGKTYMDIAWKHVREPLPSLHAIAPNIPVALELVVNRALHRNPERRFSSAGEMVTAFSHVLNERLRSPAYRSHAQPIAQKNTDLLSASSNERQLVPSAAVGADKDVRTNDATPYTPDDLSLFSTQDDADITSIVASDIDTINTEEYPSIELSMPENINRMAQHIHMLRESIQGEYT